MSRVEANSHSSQKCIARWWLAVYFCSVDSIPRKLRHLRFLHRDIHACLVASRVSCVHYVCSLYQHCSICFLTSRSLGSSQSSQPHSSLKNWKYGIATTSALRGSINYSNISGQADRTDSKVCVCRYNTAAKQARRHQLNNTASIINILIYCHVGRRQLRPHTRLRHLMCL